MFVAWRELRMGQGMLRFDADMREEHPWLPALVALPMCVPQHVVDRLRRRQIRLQLAAGTLDVRVPITSTRSDAWTMITCGAVGGAALFWLTDTWRVVTLAAWVDFARLGPNCVHLAQLVVVATCFIVAVMPLICVSLGVRFLMRERTRAGVVAMRFTGSGLRQEFSGAAEEEFYPWNSLRAVTRSGDLCFAGAGQQIVRTPRNQTRRWKPIVDAVSERNPAVMSSDHADKRAICRCVAWVLLGMIGGESVLAYAAHVLPGMIWRPGIFAAALGTFAAFVALRYVLRPAGPVWRHVFKWIQRGRKRRA